MKDALRFGLACVVAVGFVAVAVTWSAAERVRSCRPVPNGVSVVTRLDDAPPSLVNLLTERVGEVVPVGAHFDSTDVVWTGMGKHRRLIFIWHRGTRWVVATERGGYGYNDPVFAFEIDPDDGKATLLREETAFPNTVCSTASSLLVIGYPPNVTAAQPKDETR